MVFLGYSLGDPNIQSILRDVLECLDEERMDILRDRLLFVEYHPGIAEPQIGSSVIRLGDRDLRLTTLSCDSFLPLYRALQAIEVRIPAHLLRQMKEHLYELVRTHDPSERISVVDVEDLDDHEDIEFVVGVGVSGRISETGFRSIGARDIFRDFVRGGQRSRRNSEELVETTLDNLLSGNRIHLPLFKYLAQAGMLDRESRPDPRGYLPRC